MVSVDYDKLLELAIQIAQKAHEGQLDKAGHPYIDHPLAVMEQADSVEGKIVSVLHDAVEDSDLTIADLIAQGFPPEVIDAIAAITKLEDEVYEQYLERVMCNPLALKVKIADMTHNLDISRIANPTKADLARIEKYKEVIKRLRAALDWHLGRDTY